MSVERAPAKNAKSHFLSLLIALEQARSAEALLPLLRAMAAEPEEDLRRNLFRWMLLLAERYGIELAAIEELENMASIDSFHSQLDKRMERWTQEWLAQGIEQGRLEGLADQRVMLVRLAMAKFGSAAEGFDALLADVRSSEALAEIGEWLLLADTAPELAAKVRARVAEAAS